MRYTAIVLAAFGGFALAAPAEGPSRATLSAEVKAAVDEANIIPKNCRAEGPDTLMPSRKPMLSFVDCDAAEVSDAKATEAELEASNLAKACEQIGGCVNCKFRRSEYPGKVSSFACDRPKGIEPRGV
ncbi:hypothetical protein CDD83_7853 [Cordyceps sp. RAO-2017]|nr:hypothetical protein CDD83_7853 [Cordyceps sp. RAO-2017]